MAKKDLKYEKEEKRFLDDIKDIADYPDDVSGYIKENHSKYFPMMPNGDYKVILLNQIYRKFLTVDKTVGTHPVAITDKEIEFLRGLPSDLIKRLFYSLLVRLKVKPHASGWISLDFENTMLYGFDEREVRKMKIEVLAQCSPFGFETQVSGSNKPVLCFRLPVFEDGDMVLEFLDGEAREKYSEVINFDTNRQKR